MAEDVDLRELKTRVDQFNRMQLPGQMQMMHMGTSYLVNDLFRALSDVMEEREILRNKLKELK